MRTTRRPVPLVLLVAALTIGCGTRSPIAPEPESGSTSNGDAGVSPQLHVSTFSLSGWHAGKYHYIPTLAVTSSSKGWISVERLEFREGGPDVPASEDVLSSIHYRQPQRLPPGATAVLSPTASVLDFTTDVELSAVTVTVTFSDVNGRTHTVSAVAQAPAVSANRSAAELAIQSFTVDGWVGSRGRHHYWPKLRLTETTGRSHVSSRG